MMFGRHGRHGYVPFFMLLFFRQCNQHLPPRGGGGGGDNKDEGDKKPVNKTERAHELAKKVVKFEGEIARASLDL